MKATGEFTVKEWNENKLSGGSGLLSVYRVSAIFASGGGIDGTFSVEYTMLYKNGEAGGSASEVRYTGILCFEGTVNGKNGRFAMEDSGVYANGVPASSLNIIGYSGEGGFSGISGSGKYYSDSGKMIMELELEF